MTVQAKERAIRDITAFCEELGIRPLIQENEYLPDTVFVAAQEYRKNYDVAVHSLEDDRRGVEVYICHVNQNNLVREVVDGFIAFPKVAAGRVQEIVADHERMLGS